jgi:peptidoglycan/LPS O-acetylase OafA/YrhL
MKRHEQDRLLREILDDGDAANLRAASLARGLAFLQRRQRRRRLAQAGAVSLLLGLLILGLLVHPASGPSPAPPVVRVAMAPPPDAAKVKIITDEELFALFPNRALALIGSPGHQQLVFLDHGVASDQP